MSTFRKHPDFWFCFLLSVLVLGITLPFLNHAYHIDEPLFLRIAQQIKRHPFNPYGFSYIWNLKYEPIHQIAAFSPIFSYYLAFVSWGSRFPAEWVIHLSLLPFSLLSVLCMYILLRQFYFSSLESFLGAAILGVSPVFVLSANMAMPDIATLAFVLLALVLALRGWKKERDSFLLWSGFFLGLAALLRYNAVPLILIFSLLGFGFSKDFKKAILPSLIGLGLVVCWLMISKISSGESHTTEVVSVFANSKGWMSRFWSMNNHLTLSTLIPFLFVPFFLQKKIFWWVFILFFAIDFGIFGSSGVGGIKRFAFFPDMIFFALGFSVLYYLLGLFYKNLNHLNLLKWKFLPDPDWKVWQLSFRKLNYLEGKSEWMIVVMCFWILSVLFIPLIYVHFASKFLLLIEPPLILITLNFLREQPKYVFKFARWALAPALILSLLVASADFSFANLYRDEAIQLQQELLFSIQRQRQSPEKRVWFTGHWGWQYYLEKEGALPLPALFENVQPGDWILTARYNSASDISPNLFQKLQLQTTRSKNISIPLRTMDPLARAGFYSNHWAPLPYSFSTSLSEEFNYYEVKP